MVVSVIFAAFPRNQMKTIKEALGRPKHVRLDYITYVSFVRNRF